MNRRRQLDEFVERVRGLPRRASLDEAAAELFGAFEARGVDAVLLKGPALARFLYREGEHRGYSDIDVLVSPSSIEASREALRRVGFDGGSELDATEDVADVVNAEVWFRVRPGDDAGAILVDLHSRLAGCEAPADVAWEALARGRTHLEVAGRSVPVLGLPGLALHVAIHAAQHGPTDLKALGDLERAVDRWATDVWRGAAELAEQVGATPVFAAGLRLIETGTELARRLDLPASPEETWAILNRAERPRGTFHLDALAGAERPRQRLGILRRSLFPARRWVRSEYPLARRGRIGLVAAYALHLARAPAWAVRVWRYRRRQRRAGR